MPGLVSGKSMPARAKVVVNIVATVPSMLCWPWSDVSQEKGNGKCYLSSTFMLE